MKLSVTILYTTRNEVLAMKTNRGHRGKAPRILYLGFRWTWVVNFKTVAKKNIPDTVGNKCLVDPCTRRV